MTDREARSRTRRGRRIALGFVLASVVALVVAFVVAWSTTGSVANLDQRVAARLTAVGGPPVTAAAVSPLLEKAVVVTEDERFYKHDGVDVLGLLRAIPYDLSHGTLAQGGSTITEQLAKNVYLGGDDRSPWRKARDVALALRLEQHYSKAQILAAYLNTAYFGHGASGIAAASRRYFASMPSRLTLAQASLLAGLIQAPSALDPYVHPSRARARQVDVLRSMVRNHMITAREGEAALRAPLRLANGSSLPALRTRVDLRPGPTFDAAELILGAILIAVATALLVALRRRPATGIALARATALFVFLLGIWATIRSFRVA